MRSAPGWVLVLATLSCGPRHGTGTRTPPTLAPPPPVPPGSSIAYGPLRLEAIELARSDVGWDRDFVRGTRTLTFDVVLAQDRATCPTQSLDAAYRSDELSCRGVQTFPASCKVEPTLRARVEVDVAYGLEATYRCAGDANAVSIPTIDGDSRLALHNAARACFKNRNKLKPESTWTSLYELTEMKLVEKPDAVRTQFPGLLARLLRGEGQPFCRDDGAYLDGVGGAPPKTFEVTTALSEALLARVPADPESAPLTGDTFKTEHALWEQCNAKSPSLAARERCLLLRQLDKFLREVEELARPETPKGGGPPANGRPLEIWGLDSNDEVTIDGSAVNVRSGGAPRVFGGDPDATNAPVLQELAAGKHEIALRRATCADRRFSIVLEGSTKRAIVVEKQDPARCAIPFAPARTGP